MSAQDEVARVMQMLDHIQREADITVSRELANKMMQGIVGVTDADVPAPTGIVAIILAACGVLHLSMQQFREKYDVDMKTVHSMYGAYQLLFGQFLGQMAESLETSSVPKELNTEDIMGAVEAMLGIKPVTEETSE